MLSVTHRKVHKQLALKDERNIGQKHIAVGCILMAKNCLSLQEKISIHVRQILRKETLFCPHNPLGAAHKGRQPVFLGGRGSKLPTFADSRGLGVSRMPKSAFFEKKIFKLFF